jgi:hypothetical protein
MNSATKRVRAVIQVVGAADLHDAARAHHDDAIRHAIASSWSCVT